MSEMSHSLAEEIAVAALQPHFSTELKLDTIIAPGLKKMDDDRLRAIKEDAEDLAARDGYGTRVPFHRLKTAAYHKVIHLADEIWAQSWPFPPQEGSPSAAAKKKLKAK